jgi:hypothetical protein
LINQLESFYTFLIIGLYIFEFAAELAIAHIDAVNECHACSCVLHRHSTN